MFETSAGTIKPIVYLGVRKGDKLLLVKYQRPPNPEKSGWWIPAPGLEFGEDPTEKAAGVASELGLEVTDLKLHGVESFVLPKGWHLIHHFTATTTQDPKIAGNIADFRWVTADELANVQDLAHGRWEAGVGKSFLQ